MAGPASPDHIPESTPIVFVQQQCQQLLVLALDLDVGCPEGVCHRLQQRNSSCVTSVTDGPDNFSHPGLWCVSSIEHMGSVALFLQLTQSSDNTAETATRLLLPLGLSLFLWFFTQSVVLNFEHNLKRSGQSLPGYQVT